MNVVKTNFRRHAKDETWSDYESEGIREKLGETLMGMRFHLSDWKNNVRGEILDLSG